MSAQKRRTTKRKKRREVSIVGDLFRILFAVSMLIVAILIAFFVFKNIDGFEMPDLTTAQPTEVSEPVTIRNETEKRSTQAERETEASSTAATERDSETETSTEETFEDESEDLSGTTEAEEEPSEEQTQEKGPGVASGEEKPAVVSPEAESSGGDHPVVPEQTQKATEKSTENNNPTRPAETFKPDAEILERGPGVTMPPETIAGGTNGPL